MGGEVVFPARGDDRVDLVERPDATARAVVGVLHGDDARRSDVDARAIPDLGDDLVRREPPTRSLEPDRQQA